MPATFTKRTTEPALTAQGRTRYRFDAAQGSRDFIVEAVQAAEQLDDFLVLEVSAWEVDAGGGAITVGGVVVAAPPRRVSIHLDALADTGPNALTVTGVIERETQAAADRLVRIRAQLSTLAGVPRRPSSPSAPATPPPPGVIQ